MGDLFFVGFFDMSRYVRFVESDLAVMFDGLNRSNMVGHQRGP